MKLTKPKRNNIIFLAIIVLLLIPQTRMPIQVLLHKGLAYVFKPSVINEKDRITFDSYHWKLKNESGEIFDFKEAKGKVIVINFWATWCPPCIAEMASLNKLYKTYKEDVVFLFVSQEKPEITLKFKKKNDYSFEAYNSLSEYPTVFNVASIPRTLIINKQGQIVIDKTGASDWYNEDLRKQIETLLIY